MSALNEIFNYSNRGDEFYTRYSDISKELSNYDLSNMVVYCNCDNPKRSNFYKYFKENFEAKGIKKLIATSNDRIPYLYEYDGVNEKKLPINSGRFQQNSNIINMCDILVTNPPFSSGMALELINMIMNAGKKFIIVAPLSLITRKTIFNYVNKGLLSIGYTSINSFETVDESKLNSSTCWWTNLKVDKPFMPLTSNYDENIYPKYDNYDAIDCSKTKMIPSGYNGIIGVPIRFITKYNPKQFRLIGILNHPRINGRNIMSRILIQNIGINEGIKRIRISENTYKKMFKDICIIKK